jgi:xanthine dehydrogenase accessory factor
MTNQLKLWQFIGERVADGENVILLVVAESSGSSPGRAGYKMAIGKDGELIGSIGGGVMEVNLVEQSRAFLSTSTSKDFTSHLKLQVHQRNAENASGMICSGRQTVISSLLTERNSRVVADILNSLGTGEKANLNITHDSFELRSQNDPDKNATSRFDKKTDTEFTYSERLGFANRLFIIGGGHCALALSELMSKMDFHISIFDDRPHLNTMEKNRWAHKIVIIENYEKIGDLIDAGTNNYVVVMTLGYASDETVIRSLIAKDFQYFGVLGSKAKMGVLLKTLETAGLSTDRLARIRTPIGLPINSHTPEEIAVSIAAEMISVKNAKRK